jgi:hypothetical protein
MTEYVPIVSSALLPLTSLISLSIYLSSHPSSPAHRLFHRPAIALPIHRDEALDGTLDELDKDPFDLEDPEVLEDGQPVDAERFWASMWRRKVALLATLVPAFACNIALLVFTLQSTDAEDKIKAILPYFLLIPAHLVTLLLGAWFLGQNTTPTHWPTTVHLATAITIQFLTLAFLALLPSDPLPTSSPVFLLAVFERMDLFVLPPLTPLNVLRPLLPILHIPPFLIITFIRRGPPLHLNPTIIYPPKITSGIPPLHASLDPTKENVTEETQVTVAEWMLFSYATNVVRKGYVSETMDVWDLPILMSNMRKFGRCADLTNRCITSIPEHPQHLREAHQASRTNGRLQSLVEARSSQLGGARRSYVSPRGPR